MNKNQIDALMSNKEEFEKVAKKGFEEVDTNKNGSLDFNEIKSILVNFSQRSGLLPPTNDDVEQVYKQLDLDKNGKIDFNEFKLFFRKFLEMQ